MLEAGRSFGDPEVFITNDLLELGLGATDPLQAPFTSGMPASDPILATRSCWDTRLGMTLRSS